MVKYYSDQWGIDLEGSLLAVSGYSGSGGNIRTMLEKFYGNIMVEGLLIGGRVASVTYDSAGYFGQDAAKMWELVDSSAWEPVS